MNQFIVVISNTMHSTSRCSASGGRKFIVIQGFKKSYFEKKQKILNNFCTNPRAPMTMEVVLLDAQNLSAGPGFFEGHHTMIMSEKTGQNQFRVQTGVSDLSPWAMS